MRALTVEGVAFLRSARASQALDELGAGPLDPLPVVQRLRGEGFDADQAAWLLDQAALRQRAAGKLPEAERLLLVAEALEQASGAAVAAWRAARFAAYPRVLDLGAGIGGDTFALARVVERVLAFEVDPVRAALLEHNVAALGLAGRVEVRVADWSATPLTELDAPAAFADPARRGEGKRFVSLHAMRPPLLAVQDLLARVPDVLVKVAPAVDREEVPPEAGLELVSWQGELKEAVLAFGALRRAAGPIAVVLPGPHELQGPADLPARVAGPGAYLLEPDPAVIRAGLVRALASQLDAWQLDAQVAYLSCDRAPATPFAKVWRVLRHGPFNRKRVARWLREVGVGRLVVKRRAAPVDPEALRRRLPSEAAGPERVVVVTRGPEGPLALVAEPVAIDAPEGAP